MLASIPASMMNHKSADLGIPQRFRQEMICSRDAVIRVDVGIDEAHLVRLIREVRSACGAKVFYKPPV